MRQFLEEETYSSSDDPPLKLSGGYRVLITRIKVQSKSTGSFSKGSSVKALVCHLDGILMQPSRGQNRRAAISSWGKKKKEKKKKRLVSLTAGGGSLSN